MSKTSQCEKRNLEVKGKTHVRRIEVFQGTMIPDFTWFITKDYIHGEIGTQLIHSTMHT